LSSESWLIVWVILFTGLQDSEDYVNQFSHHRTDNHLPVLARFFSCVSMSIRLSALLTRARSNRISAEGGT
jgi:hypothetical protein